VRWSDRHACLGQDTATSGFDRHYVYHLAWAARVLARYRPARHVDIGSYLYFGALLSAFCAVDFYELRPPELELDGLTVGRADLTSLPFADGAIQSLSCMHVVEHVGLGRYGDALDPDGDLAAVAELRRVLAPGGSLLFVVPMGKPRVQFNAHRIYSYEQVLAAFSGLELAEFALIPDDAAQGGLIVSPNPALADAQRYGCGCFWFKAPSAA
jgi:SAM-dependent methyltransferase